MGAPDAGKSAILMNCAIHNRDRYNVHYFSSELNPSTFRIRMDHFKDASVSQLSNIKFYERGTEWADVIKPGRDNINIIDYIEIEDNFFKVSSILNDIYKKLQGSTCIAALQKMYGKDMGLGGVFTQFKPLLTVAIDSGVAKIVKCKGWKEGKPNPKGMIFNFKIANGIDIYRANMNQGWHYKGDPPF